MTVNLLAVMCFSNEGLHSKRACCQTSGVWTQLVSNTQYSLPHELNLREVALKTERVNQHYASFFVSLYPSFIHFHVSPSSACHPFASIWKESIIRLLTPESNGFYVIVLLKNHVNECKSLWHKMGSPYFVGLVKLVQTAPLCRSAHRYWHGFPLLLFHV